MDTLARGRDVAKIGTLALLALIVFAVMFLWLTERGLNADNSTLYVRFDAAERLKRGDPVLFRGVPVGEVKELAFAETGGVVVRTRLNRTVPVAADATARLRPVDVFGAQSIVLDAGSASARPLADGDTVPGRTGTDLPGQVERLSDQANRLIGPETVDRVHGSLAEVSTAAIELQRALAEARGLIGGQTESLNATMGNLAAATANLREVTDPAELDATLANLEATSANLVALSETLGRATTSLESVLQKIDAGQGTAGRMVNDPALYDQLTVTTARLDSLLADLMENPGRYVSLSLF